MAHVKRLVMKGFKSFARETVINLERHMNVVVGPNGSGKSNITDALCFVLGRLSIKSIRAAKSAHLIFSGNKHYKPALIAYVEIIWDNHDKTFAHSDEEIAIRRTVKKNGQSVYRINGAVKTRQEVIELFSQAGIDPHGFNIVLQGEIQRFVKMSSEERRRVIEEVAGISIYEVRKEKSLKELEKTDEKLKQVNAILRERSNYLKNLEQEREEALKFKKLESTQKKCRASIIHKNIQERDKILKEVILNIENREKEISKCDERIEKNQSEIINLNEKIEDISKNVQKFSGIEQDALFSDISLLRQEIAGLSAKKENYENQMIELERRKNALENSIKTSEEEIRMMSQKKGTSRKKEIEEKKKTIEENEEIKRKYYQLKSSLSVIENQLDDKKRQLQNLKNGSNYLIKEIEEKESEIKIKGNVEEHKKLIFGLKSSLEKNKNLLLLNEDSLLEKEKILAVSNQKIKESEKVKSQVSDLDTCPLCQTKITPEYISHVIEKSNRIITDSRNELHHASNKIIKLKENIDKLKIRISEQSEEISHRAISIIKIQSIEERKINLKKNEEQIKNLINEIDDMEKKKKDSESRITTIKINDEHLERLKLEVNELKRTEERNLGVEITSKQRELDRIKIAIKQNIRDRDEISEELNEITENLNDKEVLVEEKEKKAEILKNKFHKLFGEKNQMQDNVRDFESEIFKAQNQKRVLEGYLNNLNIEKAQINAKIDTFKEELKEFGEVDFINMPIDQLKMKLQNVEIILARIGNVNLRALEVYDDIKIEYDKIKEKVDQLIKEKEVILKVISQIDRKKKKTFLNSLKALNEKFSRNFSQLCEKGIVTLEPQDKKEIFNAGIDIIVKVGAGKYFDITSLSGGEQTLVALSLIFAIQELNPYIFYIFDEIDAALDKRNSEKLAYLLKKHMKQGQYIIITHNDSIISESSNILYGVSMQEGISKVLSIEI